MGGVCTLFFPWAVRMVTEWTGYLAGLKIIYFNVLGTFLLLAYTVASLLKGRFSFRSLRPNYQIWYGYLCLWGIWMVVWGFIGHPPMQNFVGEVSSMALFLVGIPVGISSRNWNYLDKLIPICLGFVGIPVVLAGLLVAGGLSSPDYLKASLVYKASVVLIPSTFYVLVSTRLRSKLCRSFAVIAFLLYGVSQYLFAKRATLIRVFVVFVFAYWIIPYWTRQGQVVRRTSCLLVLGVAIAMGAVIAGGERWDAVSERFEKLSALKNLITNPMSSDIWEDPQSENEVFRFKEVGYFYSDMTMVEKLFGRGLGSYSRAPMLIEDWTVNAGNDEAPIEGKSTTHIGMFWAFFKGGAPYFLLFHIGILSALGRSNCIRYDPLRLNAWAFVFIYLVFSLFEGFWMAPGVELITFLMGASVGVLMAEPR